MEHMAAVSVCMAVLMFVSCSAVTYDVTLGHLTRYIKVNETVSFNCTAIEKINTTTNIPPPPTIDPSMDFKIKDTTAARTILTSFTNGSPAGTVITYSNGLLNNNTDGKAWSQITFKMEASYKDKLFHCGVYRVDLNNPSSRSYDSEINALLGTSDVLPPGSLDEECRNANNVATKVCPTNAICDPLSRKCACNNGYYRSNENVCSLQKSNGEACQNSSIILCNCQLSSITSCSQPYCRPCSVTNAYCISTSFTSPTCQCAEGYTQISPSVCEFQEAVGLGASCINPSRACSTQNAGCDVNVQSFNYGTCACNNGFTRDNTVCRPNLLTSCSNSGLSCTAFAVCDTSSSVCRCNNNYYMSDVNTCSPRVNYGQPCTVPTTPVCVNNNLDCNPCSTGGALCETNTCSCTGNYIYNSNDNNCNLITSVPLGGVCIPNQSQCPANAQCTFTNNIFTCSCQSGYTQSGSNCLANLDNSCTGNSQCVTQNCFAGVCVCQNGYIKYTASSTTCSLPRNGEQCLSDVGCVSTSTCIGNTCTTTTTQCPADTLVNFETIGSGDAPDVTVGRTCYEVDEGSTVLMECSTQNARNGGGWRKKNQNIYEEFDRSNGQLINGLWYTPTLTVSNANVSFNGVYQCRLCFNTVCTASLDVQLIVKPITPTVTDITLVTSAFTTSGDTLNMACGFSPNNVEASVEVQRWDEINNVYRLVPGSPPKVFTFPADAGVYRCRAYNNFDSEVSSTMAISHQPVVGDVNNGIDGSELELDCAVNDPSVTYRFFDANAQVQSTESSRYFLSESSPSIYGQTYRCEVWSAGAVQQYKYFTIEQQADIGQVGQSSEGDSGVGAGIIVAIVLGIVFLLLLIIIIIVCCCNYGWCRKKEKIQPAIVEQPKVKPVYIPSVAVEEELRYTTPRYYLKPATESGPIISMYDDTYDQPRAHQIPAMDTQYLYSDDAPKKRRRRKKKKTRDSSPRKSYEVTEPEPKYAEVVAPSDDDLVVVPGRSQQNYFE